MSWVCIGYMDFTLIFSEPDHLHDKHCFLKVSTNLFLHSSPTASATASYQGLVRQLKSLTINISLTVCSVCLLTHWAVSRREVETSEQLATQSPTINILAQITHREQQHTAAINISPRSNYQRILSWLQSYKNETALSTSRQIDVSTKWNEYNPADCTVLINNRRESPNNLSLAQDQSWL